MNGISVTDFGSRADEVYVDFAPQVSSHHEELEKPAAPVAKNDEARNWTLYQNRFHGSLLVSKAERISSSAFPIERIRMATNSQGDTAMAYVRFLGEEEFAYIHVKRPGEFWNRILVAEVDRGKSIGEISCGVDSTGSVRVLWEVDGERKMAWRRLNGEWSEPVLLEKRFTMDTDYDLISRCLCGEKSISLLGRDPQNPKLFCCTTYSLDEPSLQESTVYFPAVDVDIQAHPEQGNVLLRVEQEGKLFHIHLETWDEATGSWMNHPVITRDTRVREPQLFLGPNRQREITWREDDQIRVLSLKEGQPSTIATVGHLNLTSGGHLRKNVLSFDWMIRFAQDRQGNQVLLWNTLRGGRDVIYAASKPVGQDWQAPREIKALPKDAHCKDLNVQLLPDDRLMLVWVEQTSEFLGGTVHGGTFSAKAPSSLRDTQISPAGTFCSDARLSLGGKLGVNVCWSQNGPDYLKDRYIYSAEIACV